MIQKLFSICVSPLFLLACRTACDVDKQASQACITEAGGTGTWTLQIPFYFLIMPNWKIILQIPNQESAPQGELVEVY